MRNEAGYQAFNTLEEAEFRDVKGKPKQPVTSLFGLLECSVEALPRFDALMSGVELVMRMCCAYAAYERE